jgi:hypothetical protein
MRKRSKYKPKGVRLDVMGYVKENMTPVMRHESFASDLLLKNHSALADLTQGRATKVTLNTHISALNVTESLWRLGFGKEYRNVVDGGLRALRSVGARGLESGKFILRSEEMEALNMAMELHDAQLEVITVRDMERALHIVHEEMRNKRATPIKGNV